MLFTEMKFPRVLLSESSADRKFCLFEGIVSRGEYLFDLFCLYVINIECKFVLAYMKTITNSEHPSF